ncbi:MAG: glycosyltransferase [Lacrimispora saccharolytica]
MVAVSNNLATELKEFMPEYRSKIVAVHNLTDIVYIRKKAQEETEEKFNLDNFHIVTCGRLVNDKGIDLAVTVCQKLVKLGYSQIRWWIIGEGPEHQNLQKLIDEKGMNNYVKLLGQKENPYSYMAQSSIYVQPSRIEAFGLTILEAMIVGCPVISTNTNGGRELIDSGKNGLLCSCSVEDILATIQRLLNDKQKREKIKEVVKSIDFELRNKSIMERIETLL